MMPGMLLGVMSAGMVASASVEELFKNPNDFSLVGAILLNVVLGIVCVYAPLRVYGLAELGRPRGSRRLLTGVAVVLAYLLPSLYLGLMAWSLQRVLMG